VSEPSDPFADDEPAGLEISLDHPQHTLDVDRLVATIQSAADGEGFRIRSLGIVLTDRQTVHDLNRQYLEHDYPTDVVSFPLDEDAVARREIDGEVYVDLDMAADRAPEFGATFEEEATRYALHGVLHLMGHDDATEEQCAAMRRLEDRYLGIER
jgi:probable rRNA maturation factor